MVGDMSSNALDRNSIAELILGSPPLIESYLSLDEQLQPNGFDLSLQDAARLTSGGNMGSEPDQRELSAIETLEFDTEGWLRLSPGPYLISFNEVVHLPLNLMALGRPRSSLLRSGVSIHTAVWDAGYRGRSQALLVVHNNHGYDLRKDARLMQLVFFHLTQPVDQGYQGRFLGENL
jgi:dUTP pyrophosphatase